MILRNENILFSFQGASFASKYIRRGGIDVELVIKNVKKVFDKKVVLENVNYRFEKGKIYGLLGRNGSGKTTLFNCIAKNLPLDSGEICLKQGNQENSDYEETAIGYVYATAHLPSFMTGLEFIKYFIAVNQGKLRKPIQTSVEYLLSVGIKEEDQGLLMKDYSHGMQNKVQMLTALILETPVLLLDEPLTSFDPVAAHEMKQLILSLKNEAIVIFSTHILQLAQDLCDEVVLLHKKELHGVSEDIHDPKFEVEIVELLKEGDEE